MDDLASQRCFQHRRREAAARCPECGRHFCRECITEHEDRVLCAACLRGVLKPSLKKRFRLDGFVKIALCALSFLILWLSFYALGQVLVSMPTAFHEGTIWESGGSKEK